MDLKGKTAIVTGGNGGLGRRICIALANAGCKVAVVYARSKADAESFAAELKDGGAEAEAFQCELRDTASVNGMVEAVAGRFGSVDILVNDAAYNIFIAFNDLDALAEEEWIKILDINLNGPMRCIKACAPHMKRAGAGRIVNISSIAGFGPTGSSIPYAISKAALNHLTKCFAVGLAPEVLVNCVAPGYIEGTRATSNLPQAMRDRAMETSALKVAADKDDIAKQVVLFCETETTTGQTLVIDSGKVYH